MQVSIPENLGEVQLYTLTGKYVSILAPELKTCLSCEGAEVTVTAPEAYLLRMGSQDSLNVVRFESDIEEDGYYIEARLLGL